MKSSKNYIVHFFDNGSIPRIDKEIIDILKCHIFADRMLNFAEDGARVDIDVKLWRNVRTECNVDLVRRGAYVCGTTSDALAYMEQEG